MSDGAAVAATAVAKSWPDGTRALDGVVCEASAGEITAVVGPNAAGKSTLLQVLAATLRLDRGDRTILTTRLGPRELASAELRARIGYLSQSPELDPEMTCGEHLQLFATLHGIARRDRDAAVAHIADAFDLTDDRDRLAKQCSGGRRRRLHIACSLMHDPELLILDEPMAGLDPDGRAALWRQLRDRASRGCAVILASHDLDGMERHADAVWVLADGALAASGRPNALIEAHGRRAVVATFATAADAAAAHDSAADIAGVRGVEAAGNRLVLELEHQRVDRGDVLLRLEKVSDQLTSVDLQRANLSSAVAALTNTRLEQASAQGRGDDHGRGHRAGRGRRRR